MKIAELIKRMEEATSFMNETKVSVGDMHSEVMGAIRPIVREAGLECQSCWDIYIPDGCGRSEVLVHYTTDLTEDKRYKNKRVGVLHKLIFKPVQEYISLDDTIEEAVRKIKYANAETNLQRLQEGLNTKLEEVQKYKGWIAEVQNELLELRGLVKK